MATLTITIPRVDKAIIRAAMTAGIRAAAVRAAALVTQNASQGRDKRGNSMKPYTPAYVLAKRESGRTSGVVDLTVTGRLLQSIQVLRVEGLRAIVGVNGLHRSVSLAPTGRKKQRRTAKRKRATLLNAVVLAGNAKRRPFFGIETRRDIETLIAIANRAIAEEVRKRTKK